MCRGSNFKIDGESQVYPYLELLDEYQSIGRRMKDLEQRLLEFEQNLSEGGDRVRKFHRGIVRNRREWNRLHELMDR